jgi:adenylate cyclase
MEAHHVLGLTLFFLGELVPAQVHLEQGIALYDPDKHSSYAAVMDPGVTCLSFVARALWHLGYPDQALKRIHHALTLAQELSHPFALAFALINGATLHQLCRTEQAAQERAEAAIALCTEHGFPQWLAWGTILQGWALVKQGQGEEGIAQLHQGLAT